MELSGDYLFIPHIGLDSTLEVIKTGDTKNRLTLPQLKQWDSEVLVRAQSISVLLKPSDEGVPSPLLRQTI